MEKQKVNHECEYQGEEENGEKNGLGIMSWIDGFAKGDRYEG